MNKKLIFTVTVLGAGLLMVGCQLGSKLNSSTQASGNGSTNPAVAQPALTGSPLDASAGQIDQAISDMQSTLQALDTGNGSVDSSQVDQALNDLTGTLQSTDASIPTVAPGDTIDQDLNSLQQTLQAETVP